MRCLSKINIRELAEGMAARTTSNGTRLDPENESFALMVSPEVSREEPE